MCVSTDERKDETPRYDRFEGLMNCSHDMSESVTATNLWKSESATGTSPRDMGTNGVGCRVAGR